jgi:hypothetical protein
MALGVWAMASNEEMVEMRIVMNNRFIVIVLDINNVLVTQVDVFLL